MFTFLALWDTQPNKIEKKEKGARRNYAKEKRDKAVDHIPVTQNNCM